MALDTDQFSPDKFDGDAAHPPANFITWGKVGDVVKGHLLSVREETGKFGKQKIYELEVIGGFFHFSKKDEPVAEVPTELKGGEVWNVPGRAIIDKAMRNAEIGQVVIMRYIADYKAEMGMAKTIDVKLGAKRVSNNSI